MKGVDPEEWLNAPQSAMPGEEARHVEIDMILVRHKRIKWLGTWLKAIPIGLAVAYGISEFAEFITHLGAKP